MSTRRWYVDTSALGKLVVTEPESTPMRRWWIANRHRVLTSELTVVEVVRILLRHGDVNAETRIADLMRPADVSRLSRAIVGAARSTPPLALRSLDAIHLATALAVGRDLGGMVVYDDRLAAAARFHKIRVVAPR